MDKRYITPQEKFNMLSDAIIEVAKAIDTIAWRTGSPEFNRLSRRISIALKNVGRTYI